MPPNKQQVNVFLASSGALLEFREEADKTVKIANNYLPKHHINLVRWETDMGSGSYNRRQIQDEIDPKLDECDAVLVLIHDRIGKFTFHEYRLAREKGKKVWVYFLKRTEPDADTEVSNFYRQLVKENQTLERQPEPREMLFSPEKFAFWFHVDLNFYFFTEHKPELDTELFDLIKPRDYHFENPKALLYRDYLQSSVLPYFSRDTYKNENKNCAANFVTETEVLSDLLQPDSEFKTCIIYGEGGIGKTRLMYELGYRSLEQGWIPVLVLKKTTDFSALKSWLREGEKCVLLFDYVEESQGFSTDLAEELERAAKATVRVIANCRYTYYQTATFQRDFLPIELDPGSIDQRNYEKSVIRHILRDVLHSPDGLLLDHFAWSKPSFAVFMRFLWFNHKLQRGLVGETNFTRWVSTRLNTTLGVKKPDTRIIAAMACLPARREVFDDDPVIREQILLLLSDGWVEENQRDGNLEIIHDTIIDEILRIHLDGSESYIQGKVDIIFNIALEKNQPFSCLRAFERILDSQTKLTTTFFKKRFDTYLKTIPEKLVAIREAFGSTSLLAEADRFELINEHRDFFQQYIVDYRFGKPLCFAMNELAKAQERQESDQKPPETGLLKDTIFALFNAWYPAQEDMFKYPGMAYRVISTYTKLFGIDALSESWFEKYFESEYIPVEASFLLDAWLDHKGKLEVAGPSVQKFLKIHKFKKNARFVLGAWINNGYDIVEIRPRLKKYLRHWIEKGDFSVGMLLFAWLEHTGEIKNTLRKELKFFFDNLPGTCNYEQLKLLKLWIEKENNLNTVGRVVANVQEKLISESETKLAFLLNNWLNKLRTFEPVKSEENPEPVFNKDGYFGIILPGMSAYCANCPGDSHSVFIISTWLKEGQDPAVVQPAISIMLAANVDNRDTYKGILGPWLEAGGDPELVKAEVIQYLRQFGEDPDASYILQPWLKSKGHLDVVAPYIKRYIDLYPDLKDPDISYILGLWLSRSGPMETIEAGLTTYLEKFGNEDRAMNNILKRLKLFEKRALDKDKNLEDAFKRVFKGYLDRYGATKNARFMYRFWFERNGDPEFVLPYVQQFLQGNLGSKQNAVVVSTMLKATRRFDLLEQYARSFLQQFNEQEENRSLMVSWLEAGGKPEPLTPFIVKYTDSFADHPDATYLYYTWIKYHGEPETIRAPMQKYLAQNAAYKKAKALYMIALPKPDLRDWVTPYLHQWLEQNLHDEKAGELIKFALLYNMPPEKLEPLFPEIWKLHGQGEEANYFFQEWIRRKLPLSAIHPYLLIWLESNTKNKLSGYLYDELCQNGPLAPEYQVHFEQWFDNFKQDYNAKRIKARADKFGPPATN